jgi:predicted AAA+ superfamily ATPase
MSEILPEISPDDSVPASSATPRAIPARYLRAAIAEDLPSKMIFIGGPRQVGKTSLARSFLGDSSAELNFDVTAQRTAILRRELPPVNTWFFDEIHKYKGWRNSGDRLRAPGFLSLWR